MNLGQDSYDIVVERGVLAKANQHLNLNRRVLIVTDEGVPSEYAKTLAGQCRDSVICTIDQGESSKSLSVFEKLLHVMLDLLKTLPSRQIANGLAEAIKMSLTSDKELLGLFENKAIEANLDEIIIRSLQIKKAVVEQDEKEAGLRKILNFGHTVGHGIESSEGMSELYHGECVALGMLPMCGEEIRPRVSAVLKKCNLYRELEYDWDKITDAAFHDKKADGDKVTVILVNEAGKFELKTMGCLEVIELAKTCLEG